ncbi:MAG: hypothetical protein MJ252_04190 [archaeon]|nr:hypothetical protein [archaeon]
MDSLMTDTTIIADRPTIMMDGSEIEEDPNYNPQLHEKICCIELTNNNQLLLRYDLEWTVKDLICAIIKNKEFKKLYPSRQWQENSKYHLPLFDLHLAIFRSLKPETETKIDFDVKLGDLFDKGFLKSYKYPFFVFKDNRNKGALIQSYEDKLELLETISKNNFETYTMYKNYLPRLDIFGMLNSHPEIEDFYQNAKQSLNDLTSFNLNPLITDKDNLDWFIYDEESMSLLVSLETKKFQTMANIKYTEKRNQTKVFLEDTYPEVTLTDKDLSDFFVKVLYINVNKEGVQELLEKKMKINTQMTGYDLMENMRKKLLLMSDTLNFDPSQKIMKIRSNSEYILNLNIPLAQYVYISECLADNTDGEFIIMDNPFINQESEIVDMAPGEMEVNFDNKLEEMEEEKDNAIFKYSQKGSGAASQEDSNIKKLFSVASFKPEQKKTVEIQKKAQTVFNENSNDPLNVFVQDLFKDLNSQVKSTIEETSKIITGEAGVNEFNQTEEWGESIISESLNSSIIHPIRNSTISRIDNSFYFSANSRKNYERPSVMGVTTTKEQARRGGSRKMPNVFIYESKSTVNTCELLQQKNDRVHIYTMEAPFSIMLREVFINKFYNSFPDDRKNTISVFVFTFQIFCGKDPFSSPLQIKWTSKGKDLHPIFNKRIYFDLSYKHLPVYASLIIKMRHNVYNSGTHVLESNKTVGWVNVKLFDHRHQLRSGGHKVNFRDNKLLEDGYYNYMDNHDENSSTVVFEIDTFNNPIANEIFRVDDFSCNIEGLMISETDKNAINDIICKTPFEEISNYDREVLWCNRYILSQEPTILPKLLRCIDYKNADQLEELEKILKIAKKLTPIQSMELLTGKFLHESVRKFAVRCLGKSSPQEIQNYLIQLVQGLKFEMNHDNELARYLLSMAISYPLTIGHALFWSLRSETYNPQVQQRYCLYLEIFLSKIEPKLAKSFENEVSLMQKLYKIAEIPKTEKKSKVDSSFKDALIELDKEFKEKSMEVSIPLNYKFRVKGIKIDQCKIMKSKKKPILMVMENSDQYGNDIEFLLKDGDDLRMDIVTLQLFKIMKSIWDQNDLKLKMSLYPVTATGFYKGLIYIVKNSTTLAEIHVQKGGALHSFYKTSLKEWLEKNAKFPEKVYTQNFLLSNVAYCCATFVLGIGDRHSDNIMLKTNGELFHIDFGHFLGHFKYKMGIKRERAPFVFTSQFQYVLGGETGKDFIEFKYLFWRAFQLLRDHVDILVTLLRILILTGISELNEKSIEYLKTSLMLNQAENEALAYLNKQIEECIDSWSTQLNFYIHIVANK